MSSPPPQAPVGALFIRRSRYGLARLSRRAQAMADDAARFPWRVSAQLLHERFREDQLGMTAGSLTFTTILALVPFFIVALAIFTAFPMFGQLQ